MSDLDGILDRLITEREGPSQWWRPKPQPWPHRGDLVRNVIYAEGRAGVKKKPH